VLKELKKAKLTINELVAITNLPKASITQALHNLERRWNLVDKDIVNNKVYWRAKLETQDGTE